MQTPKWLQCGWPLAALLSALFGLAVGSDLPSRRPPEPPQPQQSREAAYEADTAPNKDLPGLSAAGVEAAVLDILAVPPPDRFVVLPPEPDTSKMLIHPNSEANGPLNIPSDRIFTLNDLSGVQDGSRNVYLFGQIDYRDIFGRKHYTRFRFNTGAGEHRDSLATAPFGNDTDD
jgi:hypothetical protein